MGRPTVEVMTLDTVNQANQHCHKRGTAIVQMTLLDAGGDCCQINSDETLFTSEEKWAQAVSFESELANLECDELDICRLPPTICVVGLRIELR